MKLRSLAIGLSLLTAGTVIGVTTQQFASADISSGDRPVLVPIEPCRLVDTRPGDNTVGPRAARLSAADTLTVDAQEADTKCTGKIPSDALTLSLNVTAIGATDQTFLTIWAGGDRPDASSLNPAPGAPPTPNAVIVDLSVDQEFEVYNDLGSLNIIVDVNGYYENHGHDDAYYTKAEVDEALALKAATAEIYTRAEVDALTVPAAFTTVAYTDETDITPTTTMAKMRDIGTFTSNGGTLRVTWSSHVSGTGICNFGIRVDGQASRPTDSRERTGTEAVINASSEREVVTTVDVFLGLPAGEHDLDLYVLGDGMCTDNPSGVYTRTALIEEFIS